MNDCTSTHTYPQELHQYAQYTNITTPIMLDGEQILQSNVRCRESHLQGPPSENFTEAKRWRDLHMNNSEHSNTIGISWTSTRTQKSYWCKQKRNTTSQSIGNMRLGDTPTITRLVINSEMQKDQIIPAIKTIKELYRALPHEWRHEIRKWINGQYDFTIRDTSKQDPKININRRN